MVSVTYLATLVVAAQLSVPGPMRLFGQPTFTAGHNERIQEHALTMWPGPSGLVRAWESGELNRAQLKALLVGGAAFHDRQLLPLYVEAVEDQAQSMRKAAIYGYRMLLGDVAPNVMGHVDDETAAALAGEMRAMQDTLRRWPMTEMWLASLLANESTTLPGYEGVVLRRWPIQCLRALEVVAEPEDVDLLMAAFTLSNDASVRTSLVKLVEGLTLNVFIPKPLGEKAWGSEIYEAGKMALEEWWASNWQLDPEQRLRRSLEAMDAVGVEPFQADSYDVWQRLITGGVPRWWELASRQMYRWGAPPKRISILRPDWGESDERRDALLRWLDPKLAPARHRPPAEHPKLPAPSLPGP